MPLVMLLGTLAFSAWVAPESKAAGRAGSVTRRVNVPYTAAVANLPVEERAIFWFGQVGPGDSNFVDVRAIYNPDKLVVSVHVYDRFLWYDINPDDPAALADWDAATLYLSLADNPALSVNQHRFVSQLSTLGRPRDPYQAAYVGSNGSWVPATTAFQTIPGWQGNGMNDTVDDRGWYLLFHIPFASLGLTGPPPEGTVWRMALAVHDRDSATPGAEPEQNWPEAVDGTDPLSWAELHFGLPTYTPPLAIPRSVETIRQGLNGVTVTDVHVGGSSICGDDVAPNYFELWGSVNRAGDRFMNIQNQWNLADWPCFSKYYVNFPLDMIPPGKRIISATLTLHFFSNSNVDGTGNGDPQPSLVQVMTVDQEWQEGSITWNTAPLAGENIARTWVFPRPEGVPQDWHHAYEWPIATAVAEAYQTGEEVRLVLYSADNNQHSGKYFRASEYFDLGRRPTLTILWGDPFSGPHKNYLPVQTR